MKARPEARAAQIAYGYMRGRTYKQIEAKCHEPPNWAKVALMVVRFSPPTAIQKSAIMDKIKAWAEAA